MDSGGWKLLKEHVYLAIAASIFLFVFILLAKSTAFVRFMF